MASANVIDAPTSSRLRSHSLSLMTPTHLRSRSASRNVTRKQAKELIKQETSNVTSKKLHSLLHDLGLHDPIPVDLNKNSSSSKSSTANIYVANSSNCIYLPPATSASFTYEDVDNGGISEERRHSSLGASPRGLVPPESGAEEQSNTSREASPQAANPNEADEGYESLPPHLRPFSSANFLCTKIDSDVPIPHTFAVIIDLNKPTNVRELKFVFQSNTSILWPTGDLGAKGHSKEKFRIGMLEWNTSLDEADFFASRLNSNDMRFGDTSPGHLSERTRQYVLASVRNHDVDQPSEDLGALLNNDKIYPEGVYVFLLPVLLPEHIPPSITTINGSLDHNLVVQFSKISDKLNRKVRLLATYRVPMVRTPPSLANSVSNKPIYVDRVWNDSLHYTITFPRKYVSLGSEHSINIKLIPLVKDVVVKRIKFNILERITYVSQSLAREYDYDGDDPFQLHPSSDNKTKERTITVCELKTKSKNGTTIVTPYKEELIRCPDNNLLFSCYEPDTSDFRLGHHSDNIENFRLNSLRSNSSTGAVGDLTRNSTMVASPLDINIALPFLTTRADCGYSEESDNSHSRARPSSRRASVVNRSDSQGGFSPSSPIIGTLETNIFHSHANPSANCLSDEDDADVITPDYSSFLYSQSSKQNLKLGYTSVPRALYPDSNFRHIRVHHRLQICFRISKPDEKLEGKMHHYEVVVDTPLVLMSSQCNEEATQLPNYADIGTDAGDAAALPSFTTPNYERNGVRIVSYDPLAVDPLPSFAEAVSSPTSPLVRTVSDDDDTLSRVPSIPPLGPAPAYELHETSCRRTSACSNLSCGQLNIDEVVSHEAPDAPGMRQSAIRSSLSNSFAPPARTEVDNETMATSSSMENEPSEAADNSNESTSSQSKCSLDSSLEMANTESSSYPASATTDATTVDDFLVDDPLSNVKYNAGDVPLEPEPDYDASSDDLTSIATQPFELRLPLLRNVSVDSYNLTSVTTNTSYRGHEPKIKRAPSDMSILTHPVKHEMHHAL